jgi:hypothetical protein
MNTYKQFYQDTIAINSDTSQYQNVDTITVANDTTETIKETVSQSTQEQVVRPPVTEKNIPIQKETIKAETKVDDVLDSEEIKINENFLNRIEKNKTESKYEDVFIDINTQQDQIEDFGIGTGRKLVSSDWMFPIILVSIVIMIWVRKTYFRQVELLFNSVYNYQMSLKLFKDPSSRFINFSIVLNFNSAITVALFLYQLSKFYKTSFFGSSDIVNYLAIVMFLLVIYILQIIAYSVLGQILNSRDEYNEFIHHTYSLIKVLGIVVIPIIIVNAYASEIILPYFLILGSIIIVYFYFKRIQRGILILMQKQFLKVHQILYFCTLEILPLMVISKIVNSLIERSF